MAQASISALLSYQPFPHQRGVDRSPRAEVAPAAAAHRHRQATAIVLDPPPAQPRTPGERIKWVLKQRRMSGSELARRLGLTRAAVALWWDPRKPASPYKRLTQVADILNVRVEWLFTGRGEMLLSNQDTAPGLAPAGASLDVAGARLIGIAEAEVWREGPSMPAGLARALGGAVAPRAGDAPPAPSAPPQQFAVEVHGTSMNQTIAPGEYALCVDYRQFRPAGPQHGDLVVVRKRRGGNEHKIFIARLYFRDHGWELRYESHDPRWQQQAPVRLSPELSRDLGDDGATEIMGYVFGVFRREPKPASAQAF